MKHKHNFEPFDDLVVEKKVNGITKVVRIEQERCECGEIRKNPLHLSMAERGESPDGYFGATFKEGKK